jgi:hypothetical protein
MYGLLLLLLETVITISIYESFVFIVKGAGGARGMIHIRIQDRLFEITLK